MARKKKFKAKLGDFVFETDSRLTAQGVARGLAHNAKGGEIAEVVEVSGDRVIFSCQREESDGKVRCLS